MVEGGDAAGSTESQQISLAEMLLGDQDQNMLAWKLLGALLSQRKRVIFRKECGSEGTGKMEVKGVPCIPPVGLLIKGW
mgnify:CR=1 FL=1